MEFPHYSRRVRFRYLDPQVRREWSQRIRYGTLCATIPISAPSIVYLDCDILNYVLGIAVDRASSINWGIRQVPHILPPEAVAARLPYYNPWQSMPTSSSDTGLFSGRYRRTWLFSSASKVAGRSRSRHASASQRNGFPPFLGWADNRDLRSRTAFCYIGSSEIIFCAGCPQTLLCLNTEGAWGVFVHRSCQ